MSALGNAMHEQPGRVFFERARGVVQQAKDRDAALAYVLGLSLIHILRWEPQPVFVSEEEAPR